MIFLPGLVLENPTTPEEKEVFLKYSLRDAEITSMTARMLKERWNIDPEIHASVGTVAKELFNFPVRLKTTWE